METAAGANRDAWLKVLAERHLHAEQGLTIHLLLKLRPKLYVTLAHGERLGHVILTISRVD